MFSEAILWAATDTTSVVTPIVLGIGVLALCVVAVVAIVYKRNVTVSTPVGVVNVNSRSKRANTRQTPPKSKA